MLFDIPGVVDYQVIATKEGGEESMDRLNFKVEMIPDQTGGVSEIRRKLLSFPIIAKNLSAQKMLEPGIELVAWGGLQSVGRAKKMIIDRRAGLLP